MTETKAKITRFKDIPQFTSSGSYQVNYPLTNSTFQGGRLDGTV